MASRDGHSGAASLTRRVTGPCGPVASPVTRTVREALIVHGRWLRVTITRVLPRSHVGLLGLRPRGFASNPNREGGSDSTRLMASRDGHSSASSFTLRVTGPAAPWPLAAASSSPSREGGSDSTRPMASRDDHSSASSFTRRVTGPAAPWPIAAASSIPSREGGSDRTRPMASRDGHSSASSFTLRVTGPCGPVATCSRILGIPAVREAVIVHDQWLRGTVTQVLPR
jgi:hypothetical protein